MEDQEFINQLAEKLSKLGTVRPLGFHYLHPYETVPADSIICNGSTYSRALYKDFFDYITTQGWVKTEAEWQEIATRDDGFCPFYSSGDGSTNFRTPKFGQIAITSASVDKCRQAGLSNITGSVSVSGGENDLSRTSGTFVNSGALTASSTETTSWAGYENVSGRCWNELRISPSVSDKPCGISDTVRSASHKWIMCVVAYGVATNVGSVDIQNVMPATAQVQAETTSIQQAIGNITKFAAPAYGSGSKITANTTVTIQSNGFLRYFIVHGGTGGKTKYITINGTRLLISADNYSSDRGILPVMKGDEVNSSADECMFYPARYGV